MSIDQSSLTKGQIRKLNVLRKSVGDDIAEEAFGKWMVNQSKTPKDACQRRSKSTSRVGVKMHHLGDVGLVHLV